MQIIKKFLVLFLMTVVAITTLQAKSNEAQAKDILMKAVNLVQNPGGAQMSYDLKVSFYHKSGWILIKGQKFKRNSKRTIDWYNGHTFWSLDKSSQVVTIKVPKRKTNEDAAVTSQINIIKNGCRYDMSIAGNCYKIKINAITKDAKIKKAIVLINRQTYAPEQVKVKFGPIWATIKLYNFKTGTYANSNFVFDRSKYPDCTILDKR